MVGSSSKNALLQDDIAGRSPAKFIQAIYNWISRELAVLGVDAGKVFRASQMITLALQFALSDAVFR